MRRTKEEADQTRRAILQSALDTFCEKGYSKTTFDEIAKRINLTKGAVYWHFRNKPDVVAALINNYMEEHFAQMEKMLPEMKTFDDILNFFLYSSDHAFKSENNRKISFFLICQMEWSEAIISKIKPQVERKKEYGLDKIRQALICLKNNKAISEQVNIDRLTMILMNVWTGCLDAYLSRRCEDDLQEMLKEVFKLIFNGLKKEGKENESNEPR